MSILFFQYLCTLRICKIFEIVFLKNFHFFRQNCILFSTTYAIVVELRLRMLKIQFRDRFGRKNKLFQLTSSKMHSFVE